MKPQSKTAKLSSSARALRLSLASLLLAGFTSQMLANENDEAQTPSELVLSLREEAELNAKEAKRIEQRNVHLEAWWILNQNVCVATLPAAEWKRGVYDDGDEFSKGTAVIAETIKGECRPDFRFRDLKGREEPPLDKRMIFTFRHTVGHQGTISYLYRWEDIDEEWMSLLRRRAASGGPLKD